MFGSAHRHVAERDVALGLLRRDRSEAGEEAAKKAGAESGSDPEAGSGSASACAQCAALASDAAACAREFHARVLPRTLPGLRARGARRSCLAVGRRLVAPLASVAVVVAAASLLWLWPSRREPWPATAGGEVGGLAIKGAADDAPHILLRRHGAVTVVTDGAVLHPGDALAFSVPPGLARYALVVSIDGDQRISIYSPYEGAAAAPIPLSASPVSLEPAIILDGALGPERLWLLLSDRPLPVALLRPALERLAASGAAAVQAATAPSLLEDVPFPVAAATWLFHKRSP